MGTVCLRLHEKVLTEAELKLISLYLSLQWLVPKQQQQKRRVCSLRGSSGIKLGEGLKVARRGEQLRVAAHACQEASSVLYPCRVADPRVRWLEGSVAPVLLHWVHLQGRWQLGYLVGGMSWFLFLSGRAELGLVSGPWQPTML